MGGDAMTAISSFPACPRPTRLGLRAMAIAVVVTVPGVFATTTTASAAPAPSVAPARSVAPIDDPIAESAQTALDLAIRDVDSGGVPSATYLVARALVADQVGARLWTPGHLFNEAWGRADMEHQIALLSALSQLGVPYRRNASTPESDSTVRVSRRTHGPRQASSFPGARRRKFAWPNRARSIQHRPVTF